MELHGSIEQNLEAALESIKRMSGRRVYRETLDHWTLVLKKAKGLRDRSGRGHTPRLDRLITEVDAHLAERDAAQVVGQCDSIAIAAELKQVRLAKSF